MKTKITVASMFKQDITTAVAAEARCCPGLLVVFMLVLFALAAVDADVEHKKAMIDDYHDDDDGVLDAMTMM